MSGNRKHTFRKILTIAIWVLLGSGSVVLLVAAIKKKGSERIAGVEIHISGVQGNYFIDKKDVLIMLEKLHKGKLDNAELSSLNLGEMEKKLEKDQWIKRSELFFDNNNVLQVKISEREPVARIFTLSGASFYIDSSLMRLPLSDKFSARLPVFTNFPANVKVLKKQDSSLLNEIKTLSEYIETNPFWMAQIDQVDITSEGNFEFIPKLGNQVIRFGNADNYEQKFNKLLAFYKQVQTWIGWNQYSIVDVRFKNQIVGVKRDAADIRSDSLRSIQIMKNIITEAQKNSDDSTKIQLPQPEDNNDKINNSPVLQEVPDETTEANQVPGIKSSETKVGSVTPIQVPEKPFVKAQTHVESKSVIRHSSSNERPSPTLSQKSANKKGMDKNETTKSKPKEKRVPKAVMPPKTDY